MSWESGGGSDSMFVLGWKGRKKNVAPPQDNFWNSPNHCWFPEPVQGSPCEKQECVDEGGKSVWIEWWMKDRWAWVCCIKDRWAWAGCTRVWKVMRKARVAAWDPRHTLPCSSSLLLVALECPRCPRLELPAVLHPNQYSLLATKTWPANEHCLHGNSGHFFFYCSTVFLFRWLSAAFQLRLVWPMAKPVVARDNILYIAFSICELMHRSKQLRFHKGRVSLLHGTCY